MPARKAARPDDKRLKANRGKSPREARPPEQKTRHEQLVDGDISVSDLDDDELRKGRCKDRHGGFRGRPPKMLPAKLVTAMQEEFRRRVEAEFQGLANDARNTLREIALDKRAQSQARVNAAALILERAVGKVPDKQETTLEVKSFEDDIEGLLVDLPEDELTKARKKKASGN